ncbi:hypothetical protein vBAbaMPhT2_188 [Acinetobacter phage vB_AbaM_PhT2]|uniref:Prokaryotic-type class I peptide chain release factors domain-containing protein n=2 Tax=Hadassahvirus TaxID=2842716 RepID=A0A6B9SY24_9CAUD|nr:RF-1 domain peptide chain release factor [Acinetobacter phage AbTZA1]YP_009887205.1 RF-1 domain peptide chain release factor [Acinetobacter phage vB_AbaM_PhT2]AZU98739.1 hypothetical protein [Acinetobacter phage AbTZA1]QHJ75797.1 hypothetical protein vBAbaMPhT2_188 [Acinetobacter phage vB_AbaM_PhT2]SSU39195.1 peptide chain release factor 2 [Acinetobacter baumannii]
MNYVFTPSEIIVQEFRAKGASNWINRPFNGVRVSHIVTGIVVEVSNKRSQFLNRNEAYRRLNEKLIEQEFYIATKTYS